MKKSYRFCTIFLPVIALAACTNDDLQDNPPANGPVPLNVTADISAVATRTSIDGEGSASFTTGDIIRVVDNNQVRYDYSLQADNTWDAGDNPYYFQNTAPVDFRAWYAPDGAIELSVDNVIPINTKQQTIDGSNNWNKWDILATPEVTAGVSSPSINFTGDKAFRHVMCQVAFTFIAGVDAGIPNLASLSDYTIKEVITDATFNQRSCTLTSGSTTGDITGSAQNPGYTLTYTTTPFIVVPQEPASSRSLEVKYNTNTYKTNLTIPTGGWKAGHSYIYTITIRNTGLEISNASIAGWIIVNNYNDNAYLQ